MPMETVLIQTKLHPPYVNASLIERPLLMQKLNHNRKRPLTLVTAPAGYGKSTLLSCWLEMLTPQPTAWLSLDEYDDNLTTYMTYFVAAIQTMFPNIGRETMTLLSQAERVPQRTLLSTLINDLNIIPERYVLILDDYHLIQNKKIHDFMSGFLTHAPDTTHLVLASRTDPRLPIIQYRSKNQVTEIRAQDLRFTLSETSDFLRRNLGRTIDDKIAQVIYQRSEGWVTGLNLVVLSMGRSPQVELSFDALNTNNRFVTDYLMAETLSNQSEVVQEWLVKTAVLDRFSPDLCDALCASPASDMNGVTFIEHLDNNHLFIISLDSNRTWYRYHHLFEQFLKQALKQRHTNGDITALHTQASHWLSQHQHFEESLHHAFAAGDTVAAANLVEQNARTLLDKDQWHTLENWLGQLPETIIQTRPVLLLAKAWVLFHQFTLWAIPPLLETVETLLDNDEAKRPLWGEVDFFWGHHWYWRGEQEHSLTRLTLALEKIPKTHHLARGEAELLWSLAMQMANQKAAAVDQLNEWLYYEQSLHPGRLTKLMGSLVFIHFLSGDLTTAAFVTQQLHATAIKANNSYIKAWANYLLGAIRFYQNDIENACHHFNEAIQNQYVLHQAAAIDSLVGLSLCYQALNQPEKARETLAALQELTWTTNNPAYITIARTTQARLALLQGNLTQASRRLQSADITTDTGILFYWLEKPRLTEIRVLIAQGTEACLAKAATQLVALKQFSQNNHNTLKTIETLLLQTTVYQKQGHLDEALQTLNEAVILAKNGECKRPFIEAGPDLNKLLPQLPANELISPFIQSVQQAIATHHPVLPSPTPDTPSFSPEELLTYREKEVLVLLAQEKSNQEIAVALTISPHTVKRHTGAVYRKLAVKNRRQAVVQARKTGLIPSN